VLGVLRGVVLSGVVSDRGDSNSNSVINSNTHHEPQNHHQPDVQQPHSTVGLHALDECHPHASPSARGGRESWC